jgi:hypothetical protein
MKMKPTIRKSLGALLFISPFAAWVCAKTTTHGWGPPLLILLASAAITGIVVLGAYLMTHSD